MSQKRVFENPVKNADDDTRVWANLDPAVHTYFFRKVLAGCTGSKQAIINIFFQKFHEACLSEGIAPEWSLESELLVRDILKRLNFYGQPTRVRRATNPAPKRKKQSVPRDNVAGGTDRIREKAEKLRDVSTDTISET